MDSGQWTVDSGQWAVDSGQWDSGTVGQWDSGTVGQWTVGTVSVEGGLRVEGQGFRVYRIDLGLRV